LRDVGVDGKIILKLTLRQCGLDSCGSEHEPVAVRFEQGNGISGSVKGGELLD